MPPQEPRHFQSRGKEPLLKSVLATYRIPAMFVPWQRAQMVGDTCSAARVSYGAEKRAREKKEREWRGAYFIYQSFVDVLADSQTNLRRQVLILLRGTDEEMEAQRSWVACPRSHCQKGMGSGSNAVLSGPTASPGGCDLLPWAAAERRALEQGLSLVSGGGKGEGFHLASSLFPRALSGGL